jgi:hypothetical protein
MIPMVQAGLQYKCDDGSYLAGVKVADIWTANKIEWSQDLNSATSSSQVSIETVWLPTVRPLD